MKYNGQELTPITKPQIFDPPKKMLVWDDYFTKPYVTPVCAITGSRHHQVVTTLSCYSYCAEIPQEPKTTSKRATNLQLAEWLARGKGLWKSKGMVYLSDSIAPHQDSLEKEVGDDILIYPFKSLIWLEPTLENMGLEE